MRQFKVLISKHIMLTDIRDKEAFLYNGPCKNIPKLFIKWNVKKNYKEYFIKNKVTKGSGVRCPTHQPLLDAKPELKPWHRCQGRKKSRVHSTAKAHSTWNDWNDGEGQAHMPHPAWKAAERGHTLSSYLWRYLRIDSLPSIQMGHICAKTKQNKKILGFIYIIFIF